MANKWAIANGNWSDGSTWNDGVVPDEGDEVRLNGYSINIDSDVDIGSGIVYSDNGNIVFPASHSFTASKIIGVGKYSDYALYPSPNNSVNITLNCNIQNCKLSLQHSYGSLSINGNIDECCLTQTQGGGIPLTVTINGNANEIDVMLTSTRGITAIYLNGVLTNSTNFNYTSPTQTCPWYVNGGIIAKSNFVMKPNPLSSVLSITGFIDITESSIQQMPINGQYIQIIDCVLITRSSIDIPQSVVLEGYQYGDKTGTLKTVPDNVVIVNLTEQQVNRVKNCATVETVQKCFEDFKE